MRLLQNFLTWRWQRKMRRLTLEIVNERQCPEIQRTDWAKSLKEPTDFYLDCVSYFHTHLPEPLREHRAYFTKNGRGFGEDAFHAMWHLIFREFRPANFLEIGVYRGQVLSLASLLQRQNKIQGKVFGISPFTPAGDKVSKYRELDYYNDTLANFRHFALPQPELLKSFSTDDKARELISSKPWDCIYIDGNHDYEIAKADWDLCSRHIRLYGIIVLDDSGLNTSFRPPSFATAGHPGPSRVAAEVDRNQFQEIVQIGHNRVFQKIR